MAKFIFVLVVCSGSAFAGSLYSSIPPQGSSLDNRACELRIVDGAIPTALDTSALLCSGTMMNSHIFVTAGHCFLESPSPVFNYFVRCPGGKQAAVKSVYVDPQFYDPYTFKDAQGKANPSFSYTVDDTYDVSVLTTTELNSITPAALASVAEYDRLVSRGDCHFQGYSPEKCHVYEKDCERKVTIKNLDNDFLNFDDNSFWLGHGDSGSGVFCRDENGVDKFVGIGVTINPYKGVLQLRKFRRFLHTFLVGNEPEPVQYSRAFVDTLRRYYWVNKQISSPANANAPGVFTENLVPLSAYESIFRLLEEYLLKHPAFRQTLVIANITRIQLYYAQSQHDQVTARGVGPMEPIKEECFIDHCYLNILSDVTKDKLEKFFDHLP